MLRVSLAVCALMAAPSCPDLYSLATHGFSPPTIDRTTATAAPGPAGLHVTVSLTTINPNPYPINVAGIDFTVAIGGTTVFAGSKDGFSVADSGAQTTVQMAGDVDLHGLTAGQAVSYAISGTAHIDSPAGVPVDVEFSDQGTFVVPSGVP
jgi:hypothetical protein